MEDSLKARCRNRWDALKTERSSWVDHWREISEVLLPRSGRFLVTDNNKGYKRNDRILDGTGTRALRTLSGGMMAGLTSPARPWFRLTTSVPELDEDYDVKEWCSKTTLLMQLIFNRSNVYRALHTAYEELGAFGTTATVLYDDFDRVIHCMPLTVGEYCLAADGRGQVDTMYREFRMTAAALVKEFGYEKCSRFVKQAVDDHRYDEWFTVINAIEPRSYRNMGKRDSRNMPYRSVYFEEGDDNEDRLLRETGFERFPVLCGRWLACTGDVYGNSPGMEALGDLKQLQVESLAKSRAIEYQANPPLVLPSDLKDEENSVLPGGVVYADNQGQAATIRSAFDVQLRISDLLQDLQDIRQRIDEAFYKDIFLMLTTQGTDRMTATEVAERHEEKMLMLGPVLDRLNFELLDPLIAMVFERMVRVDLLPPLPQSMQGVELSVDYTSILAQSQKAITTNSVDRYVQNLGVVAQMKPEVLDKFDADYYADYYADALGIDPKLVLSGQKVALIRQERAEQQQQANQLAAAEQMSAVAKNLGGMQSMNPAELAQQYSGY